MDTQIFARLRGRIAAVVLGFAIVSATHAQEKTPHPSAPACLTPGTWYALADAPPRPQPVPELLAALAKREVVLLGEQHDDADHHQWQLQTLAALHVLRPDMVIGFESFPRRIQPVLDQWVAGELSVKQFLERAEWQKVWDFPPELYLPLFRFARLNRIPMVALNVERSLNEAITNGGWDAVPDEKKEGLSRPAAASAEYVDFLFDVFREHSSVGGKKTATLDKDGQAFRFFVESQITWDRAMAEALARRVRAGAGERRPLAVGIMGAAHVRHGYGVPHQLRALGITDIGILLPADSRRDCAWLKPGAADAVFALATLPHDVPPPRLGVRLETANGGVKLAEVTTGSLAEKTGLKRGDIIVALAGAPVSKIGSVIAAVRAQPAGTWLPAQIRRDGETLEFVIKFPPQQ
ncbi:MAG: ChaN family lipoprotein [Burkholderiales bacterium]